MDLNNRQISVSVAEKIAATLKDKGIPSPGRILILSPTCEQMTTGGILIPGTTDEKDLPRKGVLIQKSKLQEYDANELPVGIIITYGMYAGKEIHFNKNDIPFLDMDNYKFTILSESEIIYLESNN